MVVRVDCHLSAGNLISRTFMHPTLISEDTPNKYANEIVQYIIYPHQYHAQLARND